MKIGILTYHYVINYGAVLQAYALQTYLESLGHETFFINYRIIYKPKSIFRRIINVVKKPSKIMLYIKTRMNITDKDPDTFLGWEKFDEFRNTFLKIGSREYHSIQDLRISPPKCDVFLVGSDQIWNLEFFTNNEIEVYFLDFGDENNKRIAYAPSFAADNMDDFKAISIEAHERILLQKKLKGYLERFVAISVREASGVKIIDQIGAGKAKWLPDPTLLLSPEKWNLLADKKASYPAKYWVYCNLFDRKTLLTKNPKDFISKLIDIPVKIFPRESEGYVSPNTWVSMLRDSEFVLTNSYHAVVFSILFRRNFIMLPMVVQFSNQNSRIISLLEKLGLDERILWKYDEVKIQRLIETPPDWKSINQKIAIWREEAYEFLTNALSYDKT